MNDMNEKKNEELMEEELMSQEAEAEAAETCESAEAAESCENSRAEARLCEEAGPEPTGTADDRSDKASESEPTETAEEGSSGTAEDEPPTAAEGKPAEPAKGEQDEDLQTRFLRLSADFQNYRRRSENEKKDIYAYANEKIAVQLLEVLDNFERALGAGCGDEKFLSGMELIFKQLQDLLARNNIEEIDALGKEFDPNFHNAVMTEASDQPSGTVTKVFQKGYTLNKKVIRPAMVAVAE